MQVAHHLLLSHGVALQALRSQGCTAPLGIVLNQAPIHAATDSPEDLAKARLDDGLTIRWYMDALLLGSYPEDVLAFLGEDAPRCRRATWRPSASRSISSASTTTRATSPAPGRRWAPSSPAGKSPTWAGRSSRPD